MMYLWSITPGPGDNNQGHITIKANQHVAVFREQGKEKITNELKPKIATLTPEDMYETSNQDSK